MFESISSSFRNIFSSLSGVKVVTEKHIDEAVIEIRKALLEADVAPVVVKNFTETLQVKLKGQSVIKGVDPVNMIIKITQDEITNLLGKPFEGIDVPKIVMMVGLQGSGKTTSTAKLALFLKNKIKAKPFLISLDLQRPAAQEQLASLAKSNNLDYLEAISGENVFNKLARGLEEAKKCSANLILLDTAGRLQIDETLMDELLQIKQIAKPNEIIMVLDSLIGRESLNVATVFNDKLSLTGCILTRVDGDGRGGVALNIRSALGVQIKYLGTGEKVNEFEEFHPERISRRLLDMGDIVTLVEKAQEVIDEKKLEEMSKKLSVGNFDMNDLLEQMKSMKKLGGMSKLLNFLPGATKLKQYVQDGVIGDTFFKEQEAIILSMTFAERSNPLHWLLKHNSNSSRKRRIAQGAGVTILKVNQLLNRYKEMKDVLHKFSTPDMQKTLNNMDLSSLLGNAGNMNNLMQNMPKGLSQSDILKLLKK